MKGKQYDQICECEPGTKIPEVNDTERFCQYKVKGVVCGVRLSTYTITTTGKNYCNAHKVKGFFRECKEEMNKKSLASRKASKYYNSKEWKKMKLSVEKRIEKENA